MAARNRDIHRRLFPHTERHPRAHHQASGRTTRLLRLLRAHGIVRKVPGTFYYRVTDKGHRLMTTALTIRQLDTLKLAA